MVLNNYLEWKKTSDLTQEVSRGEYVDVQKVNAMFMPSVQIVRCVGTVDDVLKEKREAEFENLLKKMKQNSVDVEVEVGKAISRTLTLKTPKIEVTKIVEKKPDANEIVLVALEGKSGEVLRRLVDASIRR
jgi:hypothetical protein